MLGIEADAVTASHIDQMVPNQVPAFMHLVAELVASDPKDRSLTRALQLSEATLAQADRSCTAEGYLCELSHDGTVAWFAGRWRLSPAYGYMCSSQSSGAPRFAALQALLQGEADRHVEDIARKAVQWRQQREAADTSQPRAYQAWVQQARTVSAVDCNLFAAANKLASATAMADIAAGTNTRSAPAHSATHGGVATGDQGVPALSVCNNATSMCSEHGFEHERRRTLSAPSMAADCNTAMRSMSLG